ncbi:MAG: hypothetical protein KDA05_08535 [Phycisphaerales bacterium]|nr:hypothetical protein [Phycisphaerales bacterium]MCB9841480.1 hypothetical protein [Phycisphaeraceae bacterium]
MGDRPGTLEARLDSFGRALGGGEVGAGGAPVFAPLPAAAGGAGAPDAFMRAVAARRLSIIGVWSGAVIGGLGVAALIVILALSVPKPEPAPPPPPAVRFDEEPTFWNLRPGVEDPAVLERIGGPQDSSARLRGERVEAPIGVRPGSWPQDVSPR